MKILFTSITQPAPRILGHAATDQMSFRLTRDQGLFTLYLHTHYSPLHLLAQNVDAGSVVLENPTLDDLLGELEGSYDMVAITFDPLSAERMMELCRIIRARSPRTRIVVGGYGAVCGDELWRSFPVEDRIDHLCRTEGVKFLRELLGESTEREVRCLLPKEGSTLPWLSPRPVGTIGIILSGLGCTNRCPFCVTSAYTGGAYVELLNADQIYRAMLGYWRTSPLTASVTIYDENFLGHTDKVRLLGSLIRADGEHGLRKLNYAAFGSIQALGAYDPDELLLSGLDTLWVGVESKFSQLQKRGGQAPEAVFRMLHRIGVKTIGSWIIGQDFQTRENIQEDMDYFLALDPCFQQMSILGVIPGTPLWDSYRAQGLVPDRLEWSECHLYGRTFRHRVFGHPEMLAHLDRQYERFYREQGPNLMKVLEVNLNGYEHCRASAHELLRRDKAAFFRLRCSSYYPLLRTARAVAPTPRVRQRLEELDRRYRELLGPPSSGEERVAEQILLRAEEEVERRARTAAAAVEEPFRRYTYLPAALRPPGRPYTVEYPHQAARRTRRATSVPPAEPARAEAGAHDVAARG